jgi:hypothetical protein
MGDQAIYENRDKLGKNLCSRQNKEKNEILCSWDTLTKKMNRWNTYTLINSLNVLESDLSEEIKIHLDRFQDQISILNPIEMFLKPIAIDDIKCKGQLSPLIRRKT